MCPRDEPNGREDWPTANSRINWARANNSKLTPEEQLTKLMGLLMNITALNQLLEESGVGLFFPREETTEWRKWYEEWRPTQAVGRPKKSP